MTRSEECEFVIQVGQKRLIRRKELEEYIEKAHSI